MQDQFDRQQRNDRISDHPARNEHAQKVEKARNHHGNMRRQRMGIDHRRHRVGSVVEAVDEFKAQRDQQRDKQQQERHERNRFRPRRRRIGIDAVTDVPHGGDHHCQESEQADIAEPGIEVWSRTLARGSSGIHLISSPVNSQRRWLPRRCDILVTTRGDSSAIRRFPESPCPAEWDGGCNRGCACAGAAPPPALARRHRPPGSTDGQCS